MTTTAVSAPTTRERLLLTTDEVGALLGLSRWKVYTLIREGQLRSLKIGGARRVSRTAVDELITRLEGDAE